MAMGTRSQLYRYSFRKPRASTYACKLTATNVDVGSHSQFTEPSPPCGGRYPQQAPAVAWCLCRPYPITVASMVTPERSVTPKFFPFEFTPLYVGMPSVAEYSKPIAFGGGFVEPIGFNSQPPRRRAVGTTGEEVRQPCTAGSCSEVLERL